MRVRSRLSSFLVLNLLLAQWAAADSGVNQLTQADKAFAKYGLTGKGVIVAIIDRGIDYTHPDFRNADGTTRIKMMWDLSGQNLCDPANPAPVVYTEAAINAALASHTPLAERDAVGHGTVTAGIAAGNGRAALPSSAQYAGLAPEADLLIVKVTSEGAPAHDGQPAEAPFQGCYSQALDLVTQEAAALGKPIVALINSGSQWGPIDGTSAVSQQINQDFGLNNPGRAYVQASGDEGSVPNHARATFGVTPAMVPFNKSSAQTVYFQMWYTGAVPANVTLSMNDGASVTVSPGNCVQSVDGMLQLCQYSPGQQFYPWKSSGPDRAVWGRTSGHQGGGKVSIQAQQNGTGTVDIYSDLLGTMAFTGSLAPGRLNDYASTSSAIVTSCYNARTHWVDINRHPQSLTTEGGDGALWKYSSGGPTRDGRVPPNGGVDITAPGGNVFAAYGKTSSWEDFTANLIQGGQGYYGRQSATSGAAPITQGAVALLLQMDRTLTAGQIRQYLRQSAIKDAATGSTPNPDWGAGKLNVLGAADLVAARLHTNPALSSRALTFPSTRVGTTSAVLTVTFSNKGTGATSPLGIPSIGVAGDFLIKSNTCGTSLPAGGQCTIGIAFKPTKRGNLKGTLTVKDFNVHSPHTVSLSGKGS